MKTTDSNFREQIENLYRLHYVTKRYDHIIGDKNGGWKLFEPSKFVYAYFAFNSFYNYDWDESLKEMQLIPYPETIVRNDTERKPYDSDKFKTFIDFVFSKIEDSDKEHFFKIIMGKIDKQTLIDAISRITADPIIEEYQRKNFKDEFKRLIETKEIKLKELKNDIVFFIYKVRNNIFHGTKNTIEMTEDCQRQRLNIYSNIIIAINEMLFKVLESKTDFKPEKEYHLKFR